MAEEIKFDPEIHEEIPKEEGGGFVDKTAEGLGSAMMEADVLKTLVETGLARDYREAEKKFTESKIRAFYIENEENRKLIRDFSRDAEQFFYQELDEKGPRSISETPIEIIVNDMLETEDNKLRDLINTLGSLKDKSDALILVGCSPNTFLYLSPEMRADKDIALMAISWRGFIYNYTSEALKHDRDITLACAGKPALTNGNNMVDMLPLLPDEFRHDKAFVTDFVRQNADQLSGLSVGSRSDPILKEFYNDIDITLVAINNYPPAIRYVSGELVNRREVVLATVRNNGILLRLWSSRNITIARRDTDKSLCGDREIVLTAIESNPSALKWASDELKADREVVLAAVRQDPKCIEYADPKIQKELAL